MSDEKLNPFSYVNSIYFKNKLEDTREYNAFLTNRALSYQRDCVQYANLMNEHPDLSPDMQYSFLYATVSKGRRNYVKWAKTEKDETVDLIKSYFQCNRREAIEILKIINSDVVDLIKQKMYTGGRN